MTPNGHQSPFSTDDLREALLEDTPREGFDGDEMLAFAQRSRLRHRIGVGAIVAAIAAVVAVAVMFGSGAFLRPEVTINPASQSATPSTDTSSVDTSTPAQTANTPTPSPSEPSSTPTDTQSSTTASSSPPNANRISALCEVDAARLQFTNAPTGFLGRLGGPGLTLSATQTELNATDASGATRRVLQVPDGQGLIGVKDDGRHVMIEVAITFASEDAATEVYLWDSQSTRPARKLLSLTSGGAVADVRHGKALVIDGPEDVKNRVHQVDLASGATTVISQGRVVRAAFLDAGGRAVLSVDDDYDNKPAEVFDATGKKVINPAGKNWFSPMAMTGGAAIYVTGANDPKSSTVNPTVVYGPNFAKPVVVTTKRTTARAPQIGRNFALVREESGELQGVPIFHLIDLRTGGRIKIEQVKRSSGPDLELSLTSNDMLVRDPMNTVNARGTSVQQGWVDLSKLTLKC